MIQALEEMITLLYPRRCPLCQDILTDKAALICMKCRTKAVPIRGPKCKTCGKPVASLETEYCPDCQEKTHFFTSGRAVFLYEKEIRKSVYQFKFHNKREYAGFYVSEMERVCGDEIRTWNPDVIIPIPMYKRKKRQRGYNQAQVIAQVIGKELDLPVVEDLLIRNRKTVAQKQLGSRERAKNLENAFKISQRWINKQETLKKILLVDDIYTTGSTLDVCAKVLKQVDIAEVYFGVLCVGIGF